jgi:hypothetical protein
MSTRIDITVGERRHSKVSARVDLGPLQLTGEHRTDRLATDGPALLAHRRESRVPATAVAEETASPRPNTRLVALEGRHVIHLDNPTGFAASTRSFLREPRAQRPFAVGGPGPRAPGSPARLPARSPAGRHSNSRAPGRSPAPRPRNPVLGACGTRRLASQPALAP